MIDELDREETGRRPSVVELRTGGPAAYQGGRIYTPDPAAVARLKRLMAEQAAERERQRQAADDEKTKLLLALRARREARQGGRAGAATAEPRASPEPAAHQSTEERRPRSSAVPSKRQSRRKKPHPLLKDEARVHALHALHMAGKALTPLADDVGVDKRTLRAIFEHYELPVVSHRRCPPPRPLTAAELATRREGRPRPDISDDAVRALYRRMVDGERRNALAAEVGVSPDTLTALFRLLDDCPPVRPRGRSSANLTDAQLDAAIAANEAGESWPRVAAGLGISEYTLRRWLAARRKQRAAAGEEYRSR